MATKKVKSKPKGKAKLAAPAKARRATPAKARRATPKTSKAPAPATPRTVTPYLAVRGAAEAMAWYRKAFGAKEVSRNEVPGGMIMHAEMKLGDSSFYISDAGLAQDMKDARDLGSTAVNLHVYSKNLNKLWQSAVDAGAKVTMPLEDQFWGERYGRLIDPFGHSWAMSFKAKMPKQEMERKRLEAMKTFEGGAPP